MHITAIDFETASYQSSSAIAIGISRIEDGRIAETKSWLFRPPGSGIYIRKAWSDIHGITADHLIDKPGFPGVWPEIVGYFENAKILLAHNARFDRNVLHGTAEHYGIRLPTFDWLCTVKVARQAFPGLPNYKLPTVSAHLGIPLDHHDPASDAEACARIYLSAAKAA
jgi:DNA polymerase III subunit epsilon